MEKREENGESARDNLFGLNAIHLQIMGFWELGFANSGDSLAVSRENQI